MYSYITNNCDNLSFYFKENREYDNPFIGMLFVIDEQFVKLCQNFNYYINKNPIFGKPSENSKWSMQNKDVWFKHEEIKNPYPVMYIDDIEIHWIHEKSETIVLEKYMRRKQRFFDTNPFLLFLFGDGNLMNDHTEEEYNKLLNDFICIPTSIYLTKYKSKTLTNSRIILVDEWIDETNERNSSHIPIIHTKIDRPEKIRQFINNTNIFNVRDNNKYSIIMPISTSGNGYTYFKEFGLKSYEKFLCTKMLEIFFLICPEKDIEDLQFIVKNSNIPFKIINEDTLLHKSVQNVSGWFKQQIIKLTISYIITTDIYLIVDSDLFLTKQLTYEDLFFNNKIKYNYEKWQNLNSSDFSQNSRWWDASSAILDFPMCNIINKTMLMSVTPEIFIWSYVNTLIEYLHNKYGLEWQKYIINNKFTEFTLYWLYLLKYNLTSLYSHEGIPLWTHDRTRNILDYQTANVKNIDNIFLDGTSFFSVIQGYLQIKTEIYIKQIQYYLNGYDAVFLISSSIISVLHQTYSFEERFQQVLETINSSKQKIPNSICILIEASELPEKHLQILYQQCDIILQMWKDKETVYFTHDLSLLKRNIGHGETKLLQKGIEYVIDNILPKFNIKYIFKLGARYKLTNNFNISYYNPEKFTFYFEYDVSLNSIVYTTGLYSIPVSKVNEYREYLIKIQETLSVNYSMVEHAYKEIIPTESVHQTNILGLEGCLSYNKYHFIK